MKYRKVYGRSREISCPFCSKQAIAQGKQKIPTCLDHKNATLPDMKCACGSWLDLLVSKHGPYFRCMKCGNINWKRAMEMNGPITPKATPEPKKETRKKYNNFNTQKRTGTIESRSSTSSYGYAKVESKDKKEIVIRSDEVDFI